MILGIEGGTSVRGSAEIWRAVGYIERVLRGLFFVALWVGGSGDEQRKHSVVRPAFCSESVSSSRFPPQEDGEHAKGQSKAVAEVAERDQREVFGTLCLSPSI